MWPIATKQKNPILDSWILNKEIFSSRQKYNRKVKLNSKETDDDEKLLQITHKKIRGKNLGNFNTRKKNADDDI